VRAVEVELLRWPGDPARRAHCAERDIPCLLLVEEGAPAPVTTRVLEDWIRVPADEEDLLARAQRLRELASSATVAAPRIDEDGILHVGHRWVALSGIDVVLAGRLVEEHGQLVAREALHRAVAPEGGHRPRALDLQIHRLRRRLAAVGLTITTVRGRGYVLEAAPDTTTTT
jgi:DNA-binding response OmpR family regulator